MLPRENSISCMIKNNLQSAKRLDDFYVKLSCKLNGINRIKVNHFELFGIVDDGVKIVLNIKD